MSEPPADAETFLAATDTIADLRPDLSLLEAGLLASLHLRIAADSRTFAKVFEVEHALVLRALDTLSETAGLLSQIKRDTRTQRTRFEATGSGRDLLRGLLL